MFAAVFTRGALQCFKLHFARAVAVLLLLLTLTEHTPRSSSGWRSVAKVVKFTDRLSATAASCQCARFFTNACECQFTMFPQAAFPAVGVAFFGRSDSFDLGSCEIINQLAAIRDKGYALT